MGLYSCELSVLYLDMEFPLTTRRQLAEGSFGKILEPMNNDEDGCNMIVKSQKVRDEQKIFKEVFVTKFASALEIGPKFCLPFGYDIVFFGESAEFAMEKCETNLAKASLFAAQRKCY